jgi:hypothetical protein
MRLERGLFNHFRLGLRRHRKVQHTVNGNKGIRTGILFILKIDISDMHLALAKANFEIGTEGTELGLDLRPFETCRHVPCGGSQRDVTIRGQRCETMTLCST